MSTVIESLERAQLRRVPQFAAGDRVRVHFQVIEGTRRRTQVFEGVVIKRQGHGVRETFTVRKQSFGVGVERTFPVHSPKIEKIDVAARGDVRRAKLYYLRERVGKRARVRERRYTGPEQSVTPGLLHDPVAALEAEAAAATAPSTPRARPPRRSSTPAAPPTRRRPRTRSPRSRPPRPRPPARPSRPPPRLRPAEAEPTAADAGGRAGGRRRADEADAGRRERRRAGCRGGRGRRRRARRRGRACR